MKTEQTYWNTDGWKQSTQHFSPDAAQLVFAFGSTDAIGRADLMGEVHKRYPKAFVLGCSTAGEIMSTHVFDESLVVTACEFEHTKVVTAEVNLEDFPTSEAAGASLARAISAAGLVHVLVFSDGLKVNGSELVKGLVQNLPPGVEVTGGLSGDGTRFEKTLIYANGKASSNRVAAIGLIGDRLRVGFGTMGGWDAFGPDRIVTRSKGNELFELDGQSALSLYKRYLGEHAAGLPATGLLFPLTIWSDDTPTPIVRTILAVNEKAESLIFAGDIPQGCRARLMRANLERLVDGAQGAARSCHEALAGHAGQLALLISCVGRKLVLKQRVEEEVEAVAETLPGTTLTGFYSYGEISPFHPLAKCELHNQTMTITTLREAA